MKKIFLLLFLTFTVSSCSKMQEKKPTGESKMPGTENSKSPKSDNSSQSGNNSAEMKDDKAASMVKTADDAYLKYASDKSDANKKAVVSTCLAAGNYLMFEAGLPPREKYRPALKFYRKVLEVDPKNEEALKNKKQIEDIYESMGMPIPE